MKLTNSIFMTVIAAGALFVSCSNQDAEFPDFDYQTVYFSNQYPLRTLELGEDQEVDLTLDNQHKIEIKATVGGYRENPGNIIIDYKVDESLCDGLYFDDYNSKVMPLPSNYYKLSSGQLVIPSGKIMGGVQVELTDDFFKDEKSTGVNYVIPLVMTKIVNGADSILRGKPLVENPDRNVSSNWSVQPKDFVLYAVKYVNPWHGYYLRRGTDNITDASGKTSVVVRHAAYVEKNDVVNLVTAGYKVVKLPLTIKSADGHDIAYNLVLTFSDDNTCTVTSDSNDFDIAGNGKFVSKGDKNSIGGSDRDAIYLDYSVRFKNLNTTYATKDTLTLRNRGVKPEYLKVTRK